MKPTEETDCYCVCHSSTSSRAYCEHCEGNNDVGRHHHWKDYKVQNLDGSWTTVGVLIDDAREDERKQVAAYLHDELFITPLRFAQHLADRKPLREAPELQGGK